MGREFRSPHSHMPLARSRAAAGRPSANPRRRSYAGAPVGAPSPGQRSCPHNGRAKRLARPGPPSRQDHRCRARDVSRCALATSNRIRSRPTGSRPAARPVSVGCSAARRARSPSPRRARTSCRSGRRATAHRRRWRRYGRTRTMPGPPDLPHAHGRGGLLPDYRFVEDLLARRTKRPHDPRMWCAPIDLVLSDHILERGPDAGRSRSPMAALERT